MDLRLRAKYERQGQTFDRPILTHEQIHKLAVESPEVFRWPVPEGLTEQAPASAAQQPPPACAQAAGSCGAARLSPHRPRSWRTAPPLPLRLLPKPRQRPIRPN